MDVEELLQKLLEGFYIDDAELHWGYNEGCSVGKIFGADLEKALIEMINKPKT